MVLERTSSDLIPEVFIRFFPDLIHVFLLRRHSVTAHAYRAYIPYMHAAHPYRACIPVTDGVGMTLY
jgi:hypothetical protein